MLYDKHKGIFAAEVDGVAGKFGQCLKGLQCNRMAALLRDVGDAITATNEPNFSFEAPIMDECRGKENDAKAANATLVLKLKLKVQHLASTRMKSPD